jgi:hypothetical protein
MKIFLFLLGLAGGTGVSAAWLLSEPDSAQLPESNDRLARLKLRLNQAVAEGRAAGEVTENRLRNELDTYRLHPDRPGVS